MDNATSLILEMAQSVPEELDAFQDGAHLRRLGDWLARAEDGSLTADDSEVGEFLLEVAENELPRRPTYGSVDAYNSMIEQAAKFVEEHEELFEAAMSPSL